MKYGVAVFPSKKLQDLANSYRKRYDTKYAKVPPHITLKEPFELNDDRKLEEVVLSIRKVAENASPFQLKVIKYSTFYPTTNTIYMKVEETKELFDLHHQLNSGSLNFVQEHSFVPHITVGQDMMYDEMQDVIGRLKMEKISHEETIDRFSLLYQLDDGTWTTYETFLIGK
ncbi:YjcG family protein [Salisediminibacterium beveridgei]|uniref:Putative phosphoesterase BBEV_1981 n=1 Tax=Salisediminibacterium beveridgei TaxID=632773 RepID=A0A1D7QWG4_9BACI|nr:YjcG family protein [Salisediminibacterium beveridgei]AOM83342.1 2H phosphoesterase superfamily protein YjcG [Salisediminibacterium beveridgei]